MLTTVVTDRDDHAAKEKLELFFKFIFENLKQCSGAADIVLQTVG